MKTIEPRFAGMENGLGSRKGRKGHKEISHGGTEPQGFFGGAASCRALELKRKKTHTEAPRHREFSAGFTGLTGFLGDAASSRVSV
ncbi:MAG: hypothetical protein IJS32_00455, partial [Kiritimatiellae bacterium]|nr:hypothetical protein [Kiritimatiellia bacterium]